MKKLIYTCFIPLVLLVFCTTALGQNKGNDSNSSKKEDTSNRGVAIEKLPLLAQLQYYDYKRQQVESKIVQKKSERRREIRSAIHEAWCQKTCGDVSPSSPCGRNRWGNTCTPGKRYLCEKNGYL